MKKCMGHFEGFPIHSGLFWAGVILVTPTKSSQG